jgi:hypothetical protein
LNPPAGLPLLVDDTYTVMKALTVNDVPNVALFSAKGQLVIAKIKDRDQLLITTKGNARAEEVIRAVASGAEVPQIPQAFPYYPTQRLIDRFCELDLLAIESNYDPKMQVESPRPWFLKQRIMGGRGHLSNEQAFAAVRAVLDACEKRGLAIPKRISTGSGSACHATCPTRVLSYLIIAPTIQVILIIMSRIGLLLEILLITSILVI